MQRQILDQAHLHPAIRDKVAQNHADIVEEVRAAAGANPVLLVGMRQNPVVRKARKLLEGMGVRYAYLEYGSYLSGWRRRNALKMWSGWPTFPMVFVNGVLIGGADELRALSESAELARLLGVFD